MSTVHRIHRHLCRSLLATLFLLCACSRSPRDPLERAARAVSVQRIIETGKKLTSDEMFGRYYASPEADSAAGYILARLRELAAPPVQRAENLLGSSPASFVHHFSLTLYRLGAHTRLAVQERGGENAAQVGQDFLPLVFAREGEVQGKILWLRGRIADLERTRAPVRDRVVLVETSDLGRSSKTSITAAMFRAARELESMGAAAVLFTGDETLLRSPASTYPTELPPDLQALASSSRGVRRNLHPDRLSLAAQASAWQDAPGRSLPAMVVRRSWAARLQADDEVVLQVDLQPEVSLGQNVLVGFRGSERPNELIVLGANYDHSGTNAEGETLNGANDNATGVAALLEVAAALAQVHEHLQRSILLAFFSAEKAGQQGSAMLIEDLPRLLGDKAHVVAMISMRAVGRNGHRPLLLLSGETYPTLAAVVRRYDRRELLQGPSLGLQSLPESRRARGGIELVDTREADDLAFRRAGVPSLLLNDGLDSELYGQPDDDWKYVDADKVARVARLVFRASYDLATDLRPTALPASTRPD